MKLKLAIVGVLVIVGVALGRMYMTPKQQHGDLSLRVSFPYNKSASFYEPTNIQLAPEYFFLEFTFSPLVEIGKDGEIMPSVSDVFDWRGDDLYLKIRDGLVTASGIPITADDVIFSLKRLLVKTGNTHGDFSALVCGEKPIEHIDDVCPGIIREGDTVILRAGKRKAFLLPMLAAMDFAIIPRGSVDPVTLAIKNYHDTSGPYYVAEDNENGHLVLKANPKHFHYSPRMPQTVYLVPSDTTKATSSLEAFKAGTVDFITTIDTARPEQVIDFSRQNSDAKLHQTMGIRSFVLVFTPRGLRELSKEQRVLIGKKVKTSFLDGFKNASGYVESSQYFPTFADGGISKGDEAALTLRQQKAEGQVPNNLKVTIVRIGSKEKFEGLFHDSLPGIQVEVAGPPEFRKFDNPDDEPHMFIAGPDTAFLEDIGLISYTLSSGLFGMTKPERAKFLADYMLMPNKEERLEKLRSLHKKVLEESVLVPLMVAPYVALIKEGWEMNFPRYYGNTPLWKIKAL